MTHTCYYSNTFDILQPSNCSDCNLLTQLKFRLTPFSLAATKGISFDFFSSSYLDVSVH